MLPQLFAQCLITHLELAGIEVEDEEFAIDGEALRGSRDAEDRHLHVVSALAREKGLILAQCFVEEESNEITTIPELLKILNPEGAVVSIDAMRTQSEIAAQIMDTGADYLFCVKGNEGPLHKQLIDQFQFTSRHLNLTKSTPKK